MHRPVPLTRTRTLAMVLALTAGLVTAGMLGVAVAKTFTLKVGKNVMVGSKTENVVVNSGGRTLYTLSGDSKTHAKCTSTACMQFWPPLKVSSTRGLSKAPGISGKLAVWRHNGFMQVTLNGHPLYRYSGDSGRGSAMGDGIQTFGGTWHVIKVSSSGASGGSGGGGGGGTTSTGTTTTNPYPTGYPY